jgi:uncharacterized membrane protein YoaK (UPF0700 family)
VAGTASSLRFALMVTGVSGFLDAYTYLCRGGVFANAQTGNVIFLALDLSERQWGQASQHLWPILAFVLGVAIATHVKRGKLDALLPYPIRWTVGLQVLVLAIIGFVPASVPHSFVTVPVAFLAAMQIELFRSIGGLNYVAVATTGNLMRWVEAGYTRLVEPTADSGHAVRVYSLVVLAFAGGAVVGAVATQWLDVRAAWVAGGVLALTLVLFVIDERVD